MNRSHVYTLILIFIIILLFNALSPAAEAPRNPNSAKECAICHYRWIDTFFIDGKGTDLVPYQETKVVAEAGICFSCHDGSVVDSRGKVYNDHRHPINKPPPKDMLIPAIFPLDDKGNMQCFTCHTAHGVSSEMGIERAVFVRTSNDNSSMCMECHKGKDGGPKTGNHPIGSTKLKIPEELISLGSLEGTDKDHVIICQTCHTVHGSSYNNFLIEDNRESAQLCLDCHKDKGGLLNTGHDLQRSAPVSKNSKGHTPERSGPCGACHLVHGAERLSLWARELPSKSKNRTQDFCTGCHNKQGVASKKFIKGYSHPVNISLKDKGMNPKLPAFNLLGQRVSFEEKTALLACPTCHDPHMKGTPRQARMNPPRSSFLRGTNDGQPVKLCKQCHQKEAQVSGSDHDLVSAGLVATNIKGQSPAESGACGVCHLVHDAKTKDLWAQKISSKSMYPAQDLCLTCHNSTGVADKKVIGDHSHPVDINPGKHGLSTTFPLYDRKGEPSDKGVVACLTCHNPHQWTPGNSNKKATISEGNGQNSFLRLASAPQPFLCENCHKARAYVEKTDHDLTITAPEATNSIGQTVKESGLCGACHLVHNAKNKVRLWARDYGIGKNIMDRMCNGCHSASGSGSSKVPKVSTHPEKQLIANPGRNKKDRPNYFPLFDDKTGDYITIGDIACASCHDVHHWNPKIKAKGSGNNPEGKAINSFLRLQTYDMICKECHGMDSLYRFKFYHDSRKRTPLPAP